jgi:hypothetical protein
MLSGNGDAAVFAALIDACDPAEYLKSANPYFS